MDIRGNASFLEGWFDKVAFTIFLCSMEAYYIDGGNVHDFCKTIANRLRKIVPSIIHDAQYRFLAKRDILHNILNVQMAIDYVKESKQELALLVRYRESI